MQARGGNWYYISWYLGWFPAGDSPSRGWRYPVPAASFKALDAPRQCQCQQQNKLQLRRHGGCTISISGRWRSCGGCGGGGVGPGAVARYAGRLEDRRPRALPGPSSGTRAGREPVETRGMRPPLPAHTQSRPPPLLAGSHHTARPMPPITDMLAQPAMIDAAALVTCHAGWLCDAVGRRRRSS